MVSRLRSTLIALAVVTLSATCLVYLASDVVTVVRFNSFYHYIPQSIADSAPDVQILRNLQGVGETPEKSRIAVSVGNNCSGGTPVYDGQYCVLSPYEKELSTTSNAGLVTLCTQGTFEFLQHVVVLCHRWSSPISVAVYSPHEDFFEASGLVEQLRQCDSCVRYWVNWHFVFPARTDALPVVDWSEMAWNCKGVPTGDQTRNWRAKSQDVYPINVARNVARRQAKTKFLFSSDIELYPSLDIPVKFERMLGTQEQPLSDNQVWVLPVFEVESKVRPPLTKCQLRALYDKKLAISFHQYRCSLCHKIPNLKEWMSYEEGRSVSELENAMEPLRIWSTVKRNHHYKLFAWEPFFIGTSNDPEFDIRLTWEGKMNKMQMVYEMCMRDYDFHIIENAFLVHSQGINKFNASLEKFRHMYWQENQKVIDSNRKQLIQKYGSNKGC